MKSSVILLVCLSLLGTVLTYKSLVVFDDEINGEKCLGILPENPQAHGRHYEPVGYTLESFISLIEKIEYHHPRMDIFDLTNMILERFYFPNIYFTEQSGLRVVKKLPSAINRYILLEELLKRANQVQEIFREEELTRDEKCSLYFMIAHNINDTIRRGIDDVVQQPNNLETGEPVNNRRENGHRPREQGVVSLHSDPISAVAIGRVLVGIAAGEHKDKTRKLNSLGSKIDAEYAERDIDVLTALTLGDAIAAAEIPKDKKSNSKDSGQTTTTSKYGPPGEWNSTSCPTEYKLLSNNTSTTDAELRGSIDGYILGMCVKKMYDAMREQLKLSRLIRMYYSRDGIKLDDGQQIGFCNRGSNVKNEVQPNSVYATSEAVYIYYSSGVSMTTALLERFKNSFSQYNDYVSALDIKSAGRSKGYNEEYNICTRPRGPMTSAGITTAEYDTPVDLFVVLDVTEHNTGGMQEQIDVVGHLAGHMDIGNGAGSVTVLLNSRGGQQMDIKNETNSACATCKLTRMDLRSFERDSLASVLELLNRTLKGYEEARRYEAAVPAKAVIFFHFDTTVDEDKRRLEEASRILRYGHRDVHVYAVGSNSEALQYIATDRNTKFTDRQEPAKLADRIREEIKKVPATLQYHECGKPKSKVEDGHFYTGYVTPNTKQMWAMYPEYFLKSYTIDFRFKAELTSGKIRVCHERDSYDPSLNDKNNYQCQSSDINGQEIKFTIRNPCEGYNRDNCKPLYFSVEGIVDTTTTPSFSQSCNDANCRRTDQVKFTVQHKGVACSGALGLLASPLILLAIIYATLRHL